MKGWVGLCILLIGCSVESIPIESGEEIEVFFCPRDNCEQVFLKLFEQARAVDCAFFDVKRESIISSLKNVETARLVTDNHNDKGQLKGLNYVVDTARQYTHNKFCIVDNQTLITGSMNPTNNGFEKNNNNVLVIRSQELIKKYQEEFEELFEGGFGSGKKTRSPKIIYNNKSIQAYFCPEDSCAKRVRREIAKAEHSIYFMSFSFTDEKVADALLFSKIKDMKGIVENLQAGSRYSQYQRLVDFGIEVRKDSNPNMMHHKVFIIDNRTVITGSYNPTKSANTKNDESLLIIEDKQIASQFLEEFDLIYP